jgi:hypothetical protein
MRVRLGFRCRGDGGAPARGEAQPRDRRVSEAPRERPAPHPPRPQRCSLPVASSSVRRSPHPQRQRADTCTRLRQCLCTAPWYRTRRMVTPRTWCERTHISGAGKVQPKQSHRLSSLPGGAYLPVPHSWHTLRANTGLRASIQQKDGLSRSSSQHGNEEDAVMGAVVVQAVSRLVPLMPSVYDVPTEPTLTRGPHSPELLNSRLLTWCAADAAVHGGSPQAQDMYYQSTLAVAYRLSSLPGGAYLPVPHSRHVSASAAGLIRLSRQQNTGLRRSSSQHGKQVSPRLVPLMPSVYDVPTEPTLTRGPHSPELLYTVLEMTTAPIFSDTSTCQVEGARVNGCRALTVPSSP